MLQRAINRLTSPENVTDYLSLKSGFPNSDGINSSRNKSSCALAPIECPALLLSGTIASAANCQLTATYDRPGFIVATVFSPRGESNENSTRGTSWFSGSSLGSLPGVKRLVRYSVLNSSANAQCNMSTLRVSIGPSWPV